MLQLIIHIWADFVLTQGTWIALNKSKVTWAAALHALLYTCCFLVLTQSWQALLVIGVTHFLIDRFSLAKYLIFAKEWVLAPPGRLPKWEMCHVTGYYDQECEHPRRPEYADLKRPLWITVWLYIITDNLLHITINYLALTFL